MPARNRKKARRQLVDFVQKYPPALGWVAVELAAVAPMLATLMQAVREEPDWWPRLPPVRDRSWWRFYSSAEHYTVECLRTVGFLEEDPEDDEELELEKWVRQWVRTFSRGKATPKLAQAIESLYSQMSEREWRSGVAYGTRVSRVLLPGLIEELTEPLDEALSEEEKAEAELFRAWVKGCPSLVFFLRVVVPCVAEHGKTPWQLFAAATRKSRPCIDSLEKLLLIDKRVHHHPRVLEVIESSRRHFSRAAKALLLRPRKRSTQQWKYRSMRLARHLFACLGRELTEPECRELLDLVAQARTGVLRDADMPESSDSFARTLRRDSLSWEAIPMPDTNVLEAVRALGARAA